MRLRWAFSIFPLELGPSILINLIFQCVFQCIFCLLVLPGKSMAFSVSFYCRMECGDFRPLFCEDAISTPLFPMQSLPMQSHNCASVNANSYCGPVWGLVPTRLMARTSPHFPCYCIPSISLYWDSCLGCVLPSVNICCTLPSLAFQSIAYGFCSVCQQLLFREHSWV